MIGQILGERYEVQQLLGKKAGRRTLLARDLKTQELVIIKLLSFGGDFEWDSLKLFEREAETLKNLAHPLIPRYLDYFEINSPTIKGFALVQTYIPAQTLEQYLQTGRTFTEAEIKQIAKALLEILIYLHGLHPPVIHRDIKPSNILLGDRSGNSVGEVYLIDFGSVQTVLATETGTRTVVGTYGYMPQEQFGGRTVPASDLYSLGTTLIYLVTGTHPADLPQKDFRIQFEVAANLSPSFTNWLKWMVEPSLEQRLSSALEALKNLYEPQFEIEKTLAVGKPAGSRIPLKKPTLVVGKPYESNIQLTKNLDSLEIIIPSVGFDLLLIVFTGLFVIAWNSMTLWMTISCLLSIPYTGNMIIALLSLPFWGVSCWLIYHFLFVLFGHICLRLNSEEITLTEELFTWKVSRPRTSSRQSINKLIYIPKYISGVPALYIWSGEQEYKFSVTNYSGIKSEAELEWLAHELSDWLGLPITNLMGS
ncbi:serine/threonine-protein kinase [Nostoc sp. LPT]|uniref:serine/threonine protein kinase n=1 Tax=Nostoc sp. LPT TaxID=2815387 RepID=UPI001D5E8A6C|nr:serine/threonine-protein kinase [Nostoc sp. LPT]MBN4003953.1 serine/threonine protein kinase [Nostoc sp. LPT]